jgi:hypothetical protein
LKFLAQGVGGKLNVSPAKEAARSDHPWPPQGSGRMAVGTGYRPAEAGGWERNVAAAVNARRFEEERFVPSAQPIPEQKHRAEHEKEQEKGGQKHRGDTVAEAKSCG